MKSITTYENFPVRLVILANFIGLSIYALGAFIMFRAGLLWGVLYLIYCGIMEYRVMKTGCRECFYYDKLCCFGKGKIAKLFFSPLNNEEFSKHEINWTHILPDFLVTLIPIAVGIYLLFRNINALILSAILLLIILGFPVTGMIRSQYACKYCYQRILGCPAEKLFSKEQK